MDFNNISDIMLEVQKKDNCSIEDLAKKFQLSYDVVESCIWEGNMPKLDSIDRILSAADLKIEFDGQIVGAEDIPACIVEKIQKGKRSITQTMIDVGLCASYILTAKRKRTADGLTLQYICDELGYSLRFVNA